MRLLLVEDSWRLSESLTDGLSRSGHAVSAAHTLAEARALLSREQFQAIILDRRLPDGDGLEILDEVRAGGLATHVLVLTARDTVDDRVTGLRRGADDYLVKPFAFDELLARLEAIYRRSQRHVPPALRVGDVLVDTAAKSVSVGEAAVDLTRREYALLEFLAFRAGEVVTRGDLERHLYEPEAEPTSNAVDRLVCAVRGKLGAAGAGDVIRTRRGLGYMLVEGASS